MPPYNEIKRVSLGREKQTTRSALQGAIFKWSGVLQLNQINLVVWAHAKKYGVGYSQCEKLSSDLASPIDYSPFVAVSSTIYVIQELARGCASSLNYFRDGVKVI